MSHTQTLAGLAVLSIATSGCLQRNYTVTMSDQPSETAHYVIVKTKLTGKMKVFDCQSQPVDGEWDPTCKQVKFQSAMGEVLDETWDKVRKK
jgi:hypothetical protein